MSTGAKRVRTFTGRTMDEALAQIREEMGPDAVILQARNVRRSTWWGARGSCVEVVAGMPASDSGRVLPTQASRSDLERQVADLRWLVEHAMNKNRSELVENETPVVAEARRLFAAQGLPDTLSMRLIDTALVDSGGARDNRALVHDALLSILSRMLPTSGPIRVSSRRTARIALVGPTGVGKTTTIAKLAAHFMVRERRTCGFLAADTYRIAAVDQLKRYASLMNAPLRIARTPEDVARAAAALSSCDVVFIDTAGRSPRDATRMEELKTFLRAARSDEVHLALSLAADTNALFAAIDRFRPLGVNRLILTKLDECERSGGLLQAVARAGLPVSHVTTGQEVPDDIVLADSRELARAVIEGPGVLLRKSGSAAGRPLRRSA